MARGGGWTQEFCVLSGAGVIRVCRGTGSNPRSRRTHHFYNEGIITRIRAFPAPLRGLTLFLHLYPGPRPGSKMIPPLRGCLFPGTGINHPDKQITVGAPPGLPLSRHRNQSSGQTNYGWRLYGVASFPAQDPVGEKEGYSGGGRAYTQVSPERTTGGGFPFLSPEAVAGSGTKILPTKQMDYRTRHGQGRYVRNFPQRFPLRK